MLTTNPFVWIINIVTTIFTYIFLLILIGCLSWLGKTLFGYFTFRKNLKEQSTRKNLSILQIRFPKNVQEPQKAMEAVLSSIHGLLRPSDRLFKSSPLFSLELALINQHIYFYLVVPLEFRDAIKGQIFAAYPEAEIKQVDDYTTIDANFKSAFTELKLAKSEVYPLKVYSEFETDPFNKIAGILTEAGQDEQVWIQFVLKPASSKWWLRGWSSIKFVLLRSKEAVLEETELGRKGARQKLESPAFRGKIRIVYLSKDLQTARRKLANLLTTFKQFSGINTLKKPRLFLFERDIFFDLYKLRNFWIGVSLFSISEIATIFHPPSSEGKVPYVVRTISKKAEPPETLPIKGSVSNKEVSIFGKTNFRDERHLFGIKREDRRRHVYIVGKTGVGKSKLLQILMISDIIEGYGLAFLDPHGDLAEEILAYVPKNRIDDIVYFNPTDQDFPIAFNPLETTYNTGEKHIVTTGFIAIFKKLFWQEWTPRMEQIIRYTVLALLESPNSSVLGITKMLVDKDYRQKIIQNIQDPVVKSFWTQEFISWSERYANEAIVPLLNKVGEFISNPMIRNTVGQIKNAFNLEEVLNENKILIVNLSRGLLGEENSALLGSMIVTKIQQSAFARAKIPQEERKDFYLYVDEFQNFATSAFTNILSEARKYRLNLTVAHQYIAQLTPEVQSTIFGNVGSLIIFHVGGEDAAILAKEFTPIFSTDDMLNLNIREMYIKMSIDGKTMEPFSARTIDVPKPEQDNSREVRDVSRNKYGRRRVVVEEEIAKWAQEIEIEPKEGQFEEPLV